MNPRESALKQVGETYRAVALAQFSLHVLTEAFSDACREAHSVGVPDREISDLTKELGQEYDHKFSRARIQQFRCGDPRKVKVAA